MHRVQLSSCVLSQLTIVAAPAPFKTLQPMTQVRDKLLTSAGSKDVVPLFQFQFKLVSHVQDFYNLTDVYLDAVFHPRCLEDAQVFQQEGWHYELDSAEGEMQYKGVVFNEMKGVYSQPDSVHYRQIQQHLFPDNNYVADSGGDPQVIPELTYDRFKEFHGRYYHPSNARCSTIHAI
jgi:hypothetical protein